MFTEKLAETFTETITKTILSYLVSWKEKDCAVIEYMQFVIPYFTD